jgi:hypothetical protein
MDGWMDGWMDGPWVDWIGRPFSCPHGLLTSRFLSEKAKA